MMIAHLKLFRWPNLLITALTMVLVRYCLIVPFFSLEGIDMVMPLWVFIMLVASTVFIAAAGYAINDYFDIRIDRYNNPHKMILGKRIPVRRAIMYHWILSGLGIGMGFAVAAMVGKWQLGMIHVVMFMLLLMYSVRYKRTPLWGNLMIAFAAAMAVGIVWIFDFFAFMKDFELIRNGENMIGHFGWIKKTIWFMSIFAFLTTLIREVIKDIEDLKGDERYGCRTLPVVIGVSRSKWVINFLILISVAFMSYAMIELWSSNLAILVYYFALIIAFFVYLFVLVLRAKIKEEYTYLSMLCRVIILAGILSMQLFYILT